MPRNLIRQFEQVKGTYTFFYDMYRQYAEEAGRHYYTGTLSVISGSSTVTDISTAFEEDESGNFIIIDDGPLSGVYLITSCNGGFDADIYPVLSGTNPSISYRRHYYKNLEDDLNYLRKTLQLITGATNWYDDPAVSLVELSNPIFMAAGTNSASLSGSDVFTFIGDGSISVSIDPYGKSLTISGGGGTTSGTVGLPSDGSWDEGISGITADMTVADALDSIDELLAAIAPSPAGLLTSQNLVLSNTTLYNAKLANNLSDSWYADGKSPGDSINDYVIDNTFRITSPDQTTRFRCGRSDFPEGILSLKVNDNIIDSYDVSSGIGSSSLLTITDVSTYNSIWEKANAYADITQASGGYVEYKFDHTIAGITNTTGIRYDDICPAAYFSYGPTVSGLTLVPKYLSGVTYYGQNSIIRVSFTSANSFNQCYHSTHVAELTMNPAAITTNNQNPVTVPNYDDSFVVTDLDLTLSVPNTSSNSPYLRVSLYKPTGVSTYSDVNLDRGVCTYGTTSTITYDSFYDEVQRLLLDTDVSWVSSDPLTNGNAQVRNGVLQFPDTGDYPGFSGDQEYQRHIYKTSASIGYLNFVNILYSNISAYGTGDLNILIQLDTNGLFFDLGKVVGDNNGDGSGLTRSDSIGARISGSGSSVYWSIGTNTTADNDNRYRIIIIFKNSNYNITSITGT